MTKKKKVIKNIKTKNNNTHILLRKLENIEKTQLEILDSQKKILKQEKSMSKKEDLFLEFEKKGLAEEKFIESQEREEIEELKKIEALEEDIKKKLDENPLKKITYRDVTKGMIGAFFGIVGHFAFAKGVEIAEHFTFLRATSLFVTSFIIIILFLYFSGFRTVNEKLLFKFLPARAIVIYFSAIITIFIVLLLYGKIYLTMEFSTIYNTVAAISLLAVLGAGTADLIGKNE